MNCPQCGGEIVELTYECYTSGWESGKVYPYQYNPTNLPENASEWQLEWESEYQGVDETSDYSYKCPSCGHVLAHNSDEVEAILIGSSNNNLPRKKKGENFEF